MTDASGAARRRLLVLNAGSSSLKFSLLGERGEELAPDLEGVFERLSGGGEPHFVARRPDGTVLEERRWAPNAHVGQARALETLLAFVRGTLGDAELSGVGHQPDNLRPIRLHPGCPGSPGSRATCARCSPRPTRAPGSRWT